MNESSQAVDLNNQNERNKVIEMKVNAAPEVECVLDVNAIKNILPHRYPFLLIDRVTKLVKGEYVIARKLVSANEMYFNGHFPERPVMPGVLVLEAMAQAAAILAKMSPGHEAAEGKEFFLAGLDEVKWRKQVVPGDVLEIRVDWIKRKKTLLIVQAEAHVDGGLVAQGRIMAAEVDI